MDYGIRENRFAQLSELVSAKMGLHFPPERWRDLRQGIASAARALGFDDVTSCVQWLISSPLSTEHLEILAGELTVGETYFLRERQTLEVFTEHILPQLVRTRQGTGQRLRIWSAGCCSGEEAYSLAILLTQAIPGLSERNVTILGTDINPRFLQKAVAGIYTDWSFRDNPAAVQKTFFTKRHDGRWEVVPQLKRMVNFTYLNLAEDIYPSLTNNTNAMDVIFCRNVLMYFAPEQVKRVTERFCRALVEGGWLVVSATEVSHTLSPQLVPVHFDGAIVYRKDSAQSGRPPWVPTPAESLPVELADSHADHPAPLVPPVMEIKKPADPYEEATTLYQRGDYARATERLHALLSGQADAKCMTLLARSYANLGMLGEALEWCEKALVADKLDPASHYFRAAILQEQGFLDEAKLSLVRALYLNPSFVLAHFALRNLALSRGEFSESEKHAQNAVSLLSRYPAGEILPESEGITAGRLFEIIRSTTPDWTCA